MKFTTASWFALLGLLLISPLVRAADAPVNKLTAEEEKAGWKLLFDGESTKGWRNFKKDSISGGWKVVDGTLARAENNAGDIVTTDKYGAFELSLDYKISKGGNSGLMYHVTEEEGAPWATGPEIQIQDNKDGHDPQKSGWLYQLYKPELNPTTKEPLDATKPAGEWNTVRILITPQKCEQYMNGVKYCEYVKGSKDWDEKVAASKFGAMPKFGKATEGFISLQDHGNEVAYRNIKIRPIAAK